MSAVDKAKDKAEEVVGKVKQVVGEHTDNKDLQAEGQAEETKGNLKQAGEKAKDAFS